jgi:Carboxypeptidase regulatory-like domain
MGGFEMRFIRAVRFAALLTILALVLPGLLQAQSVVTGGTTGVVTDPSGAVIVGANVTLKNLATGETQTMATNSTGIFQFSLLKPGDYSLTVGDQGFMTGTVTLHVLLGQITTSNVKLDIGSGTTTVEVKEQGTLLQTEDANIASNFDTSQIRNVPNPGGDLTYIAQIAPGVSINSTGSGYGNFSAFGLPGTANLFTINGNDDNDAFLNLNNSGASNLLLGSNELQEVAVVSNAYTGQYGRQAGAQVDYSTLSGGNAFHGDAVYDWNGRALNAEDYFLKSGGAPRPFVNNNQWAAAIGGPIKKDKAFFFINTEGIRYTLATSNNVFVPSADFQKYVLAQPQIAGSPTTTAFYNNIFSLYNGANGINRAVPVLNSCGGITAQVNADQSCLDNFRNSNSNQNTEWLVSGRIDYSFSDSDKLFGRVKFDRGRQPTYTDPINPIFNISSTQPEDDGQLNYTHVFSPSVVNSFIFSNLYYSAIFSSQNLTGALDAFPAILTSTDTSLTPLGSGSGSNPTFAIFPQGRNVEQWQIIDDLSISRGNHDFKLGVNFRRDDVSDHTAAEGSYPTITTNLLDFSQNIADNTAQQFALQTEQPIAFYSLGLYFQDEYRVNSKLKLTLALRADRNSGGVCQSDCASLLVDPFNSVSHDPTIPYNQLVNAGRSSILPGVEKVVFQPRFGLAWSPVGQNTVFRAGVGLFSDLYPGTILDRFTTNFPEVTNFTLTTGNIAFGEPNSAASIIGQCNAAFQSNFNSGGNLQGFINAAPPACSAQGPQVPNLNDVVSRLQNPKYIEWNAEIQHTFGTKTVVSANYVGNRGYDELLINPYLNAFGGLGGLPQTAPDPRLAYVNQLTNGGISNYNGITFSAQQNVWKGLSGRFNYTYSHSLDDVSNGGILAYNLFNGSLGDQISPFNTRLNYGPADYDLRHVVTASYVWDLPFKSNSALLDRAIAGWTVSGTFFYHSGFPFSIVDGTATNALYADNVPPSAVASVLAEPIGSIPTTCTTLQSSSSAPIQNAGCFASAQFATATTFGTIARNAFRGPGYFNSDFSLRKSFTLTERLGFQIGANAYNIFNHPNFTNPSFNTLSSTFGLISSTVSPPTTPYGAFAGSVANARILQITGKLTF